MVSPKLGVTHEGSKLYGNVVRIDADVLSSLSERARPVPDLAEQALLQGDDEVVGQDVGSLSTEPA